MPQPLDRPQHRWQADYENQQSVATLRGTIIGRMKRAALLGKLTLLALFVVLTNPGWAARIHTFSSVSGAAIFFAIWAVSIIALVYVAFFAPLVHQLVWASLFCAAVITAGSFHTINGHSLGFLDFEKLVSLIAFIDNVFGFYGSTLVLPSVYAALGLAAILIPPARQRPWRYGIAIELLPVLAIIGVLYVKAGEGTNGLPAQYTSPSYLGALGIERLRAGKPPLRDDVKLAPTTREIENIVVIMDESVRGDLLDLAREGGATTGLVGRSDLVDFGVASSIANCSNETNVSFRYGVGKKDYLRQLGTNASIWAFAKKAGYHTFYLDAQRDGGRLQNGMDEAEHALIEHHVQLGDGVAPVDRDRELGRALRRVLDDRASHPAFVYVNKMGAHFPYEGKYPPSSGRYAPTMARGYFGNEADPEGELRKILDNAALANDDDFHRRFRGSYLNAVSWNAHSFFEPLLAGLDLTHVVIVYTSDHGQDLHDDGRAGLNTHCTIGSAHGSEGRVPMIVLTGDAALRETLATAAAKNRDKVSQFNLFPTVLRFMGYEAAPSYSEPSLDDRLPPDNQRFISTFFTRFGGKPVWNEIR